MSGEYYCEYCGEPIWDSLHCCGKKYEYEFLEAAYEVIGWSQDTICQIGKGESMQCDTAGNPIIFYDMCAYCNMTTGGQHESHCPCYQPPLAKGMVECQPFVKLTMAGLGDIFNGRFTRVRNNG